MKIAINGAGIAGPTLAYWLLRSGHEVLLVEEAPQLRRGGYVIDFWGVGYDIAEKMGLILRLKELGYQVREVRLVDRHGHTCGGFSTDVFDRMTGGRFTSLRRSDLAATIYGAIDGKVETLFDDSIAGIEEQGDRVRVRFDHTAPRDVDLVVGADGLHSRMRGLVFGPEDEFEISLGYHVAAFEAAGYRPRDELVYVSHGIPGRQVSRFSMREDRTLFLFVFRDEYLTDKPPSNDNERKAALRMCLPILAGNAREFSKRWRMPAISISTASAKSAWTAGQRNARRSSAMPRLASPCSPARARASQWPRPMCWRESCIVAREITPQRSRAIKRSCSRS